MHWTEILPESGDCFLFWGFPKKFFAQCTKKQIWNYMFFSLLLLSISVSNSYPVGQTDECLKSAVSSLCWDRIQIGRLIWLERTQTGKKQQTRRTWQKQAKDCVKQVFVKEMTPILSQEKQNSQKQMHRTNCWELIENWNWHVWFLQILILSPKNSFFPLKTCFFFSFLKLHGLLADE